MLPLSCCIVHRQPCYSKCIHQQRKAFALSFINSSLINSPCWSKQCDFSECLVELSIEHLFCKGIWWGWIKDSLLNGTVYSYSHATGESSWSDALGSSNRSLSVMGWWWPLNMLFSWKVFTDPRLARIFDSFQIFAVCYRKYLAWSSLIFFAVELLCMSRKTSVLTN